MATTLDNPLFDQDGFLVDPTLWDENLARHIAAGDGLGELGEEHWAIIRFLREHYLGGGLPAVGHVCRVNQFDRLCIPTLFQSVRSAWRIAGLPNPGEEAKAYM
jgi:tRNA 2-thiouridine synthesizing protein E